MVKQFRQLVFCAMIFVTMFTNIAYASDVVDSGISTREAITQAAVSEEQQSLSLPLSISQDDWNSSKKTVSLSTGIKMKYIEMGNKKGEDIILLHGITDSSRSWSLAAPYFAKDYHVYILDQRGFGETTKPKYKVYPLAMCAEDIAAFMDKKNITKAAIVGHSMGSVIAQLFAISYPERVSELVLESTYTQPGHDRGMVDYIDSMTSIDAAFIDEWDGNPNPVNEEFLNYVKSETANLPLFAWRAAFRGMSYEDHHAFIQDISMPTMIFWGELDPLFGADTQVGVKEDFPDAEYVVFPNTGHNIHWEQPQQIAEDIIEFIE